MYSPVVHRETRFLPHSKAIPWTTKFRFYQRDSESGNRSWGSKIWSIVRSVFIATGGFVWCGLAIAYFSLDKVTVDLVDNDNRLAAYALQKKLSEHFFKETDEERIIEKDTALENMWKKLSEEERIIEVFGQPVLICGYNYVQGKKDLDDFQKNFFKMDGNAEKVEALVRNSMGDMETPEDHSVWEAECYVQGPKCLGQMNAKFQKFNNEWVPLSLHLETLDKSDQVICEVSGSLPNGIKNFTRLSSL